MRSLAVGRMGSRTAARVLAAALVAVGCAAPPAPAPLSAPERAFAPPPSSPEGRPVPLASEPPAEPEPLNTARRVLLERAPRLDPLAREAVAWLVSRAQHEHALPALTLLALIEQESHFDPAARGPRGSLGLMQIRPFVARAVAERHGLGWEGDASLLDPVVNVRIGIAYLAEQRARFGTTELALAAYNVGPSRLRRLLAAGRSGSGRYVRRVLQRAEALAAE